MPVQAFVDDSGGKGHSRHFVLVGLVSDSERWAKFSDEWLACLQQSPSVRIFKMRDAASCTGDFHRFTDSERNDRLRRLARIINRHVEFVIDTVIDLDAHSQTWARLPKPRSDVYFWPFHTLILGTCFELWEECHWRERFEIIFDEQLIFGERARRWYPMMLQIMRLKHPDEASIMPIDPMFRKDDEFLPLQAADLFAWCFRKNSDEPDSKAFEWLLAEMPNVSEATYSNYYDLERMKSGLDEAIRIAKAGEVPAQFELLYAEIQRRGRR